MSKLIVIVGPTASGKSDLAVAVAKKFNGEVVSADSRQVYKGMDIGSGKVPRDSILRKSDFPNIGRQYKDIGRHYIYKGIRHHLLDVVSPKRTFTVAQYQKLARKVIEDIWKRGKLPILCGGTGFYVDAVVDGIVIPEVKPNTVLRERLEHKTTKELFALLKRIDLRRAKQIDKHNPRRLIRAIEIAQSLGAVPKLQKNPIKANVLKIGIMKDKRTLQKLIEKRLMKRMKQGMVAEVKRLHRQGVSWKRLEDFGLEYKYIALFLRDKLPEHCYKHSHGYSHGRVRISRAESERTLFACLKKETWQYAKRQMTWFKKDKNIHWVKNQQEAMRFISIKNPAP